MSTMSIEGRGWRVVITTEQIEYRTSGPSYDESWKFTDAAGHVHYRAASSFPTLDLIVDVQHWCYGDEGMYNHDPHMAVDASHYECRVCREVIAPRLYHGDLLHYVAGPTSGVITGLRGPHHDEIDAYLTPAEITVIGDAMKHARTIHGRGLTIGTARAREKFVDPIIRSILFNIPESRIYAWRQTTRF